MTPRIDFSSTPTFLDPDSPLRKRAALEARTAMPDEGLAADAAELRHERPRNFAPMLERVKEWARDKDPRWNRISSFFEAWAYDGDESFKDASNGGVYDGWTAEDFADLLRDIDNDLNDREEARRQASVDDEEDRPTPVTGWRTLPSVTRPPDGETGIGDVDEEEYEPLSRQIEMDPRVRFARMIDYFVDYEDEWEQVRPQVEAGARGEQVTDASVYWMTPEQHAELWERVERLRALKQHREAGTSEVLVEEDTSSPTLEDDGAEHGSDVSDDAVALANKRTATETQQGSEKMMAARLAAAEAGKERKEKPHLTNYGRMSKAKARETEIAALEAQAAMYEGEGKKKRAAELREAIENKRGGVSRATRARRSVGRWFRKKVKKWTGI